MVVGSGLKQRVLPLPRKVALKIKSYQLDGIQFLWNKIIGQQEFEASPGTGCILAHSMGLGKTMQLCIFSDLLLQHTSCRTILILTPLNTIGNWAKEYDTWLDWDPDDSSSSKKLHFLNSSQGFNHQCQVFFKILMF